ncbi:phosphoenolpyruvate synthase [Sulfurimonas lithotrophica]|uniref:Phosphoenolpyruvate synthase n=1 Tax=Sulfurimonas lithotrophica TaxID=2590022 RepID=A0A5P8P1R2_9BACT|nr:phosphoenolpyruvate synthase [Sulfurimonas lithotrophica]QFR49639.1 phosphoenolpyruvate synthase [Sulfurimonas lithotrophica]
MKYICFFEDLSINDIPKVGGKNASLGEMYNQLSKDEINIPNGFATTSDAYWLLLQQDNLKKKIHDTLKDLDATNTSELQKKAKKVRELILNTQLPKELQNEISDAYKKLSKEYDSNSIDVAVRSSGTAEDLPDASFAGQQETFLNINSPAKLLESVHLCFASLFNDRAISYRDSRGYDHFKVALSVGVQKMVRSDSSSSGVMFSIDTQSGSKDLVLINSIWGLGENIVSGRVNADEFLVYKPTLKKGINTILKRSLGSKKEKLIYTDDGKNTLNIPTSQDEQNSFSINDEDLISLAKQALIIENHYKKPMDIEWAKDANDLKLYIVQARPETVQSKKQKDSNFKKYELKSKDAKVLTKGIAAGERIGSGRVHIINDISEFSEFQAGEVLVASTTNPDWEPLMKKASAVVTDKGSRTCHAAIVAREIGVSAVVGCTDATDVLKNNQEVTVSCADGEDGLIYEGILDYSVKDINLDELKTTKTKLYMNVADPSQAFKLSQIPNDGVGLARMEFIMNNSINTHPMALVDMYKGKKVKDEDSIRLFMTPYTDAKEFFIKKLSEGIGMIAAAFYPKSVIVRTSDFKSNEYKNMPGGFEYEAYEENPMIGFRGASRYYDESYKEAFEWECQALKYVRDDMGLVNVKIMLPFVRTVQEGKNVIKIMNEQGLMQGKNSLEIYAMCEIPANVILAEQFLEVFDGFSIGSNDLTQLTLGVDRDSAKIAHIFDERNDAIKEMLKMVIKVCKDKNKYIGICGQAPSDYPEITRFLVENKIDSISLNPDSLYEMNKVVSEFEVI